MIPQNTLRHPEARDYERRVHSDMWLPPETTPPPETMTFTMNPVHSGKPGKYLDSNNPGSSKSGSIKVGSCNVGRLTMLVG